MVKTFVLVLVSLLSFFLIVSCGSSSSTDAGAEDFAKKLSTAYSAESAFETALAAAPDLATAKSSKEFTAMQAALDGAKAAAKSDADKDALAKLQKMVDVLVNQ